MKDELEANDAGDLDERSLLGDRFPRPKVPGHLENRVAKSLTEAGLLTRPGGRTFRAGRNARRIAAGLLLFVAGFGSAQLLGSSDNRPVAASVDSPRRYALLLYAGSVNAPPVDDVVANQMWARKLVAEGREVSGEKLSPGGAMLAHSDGPGAGGSRVGEDVQGFFIVSAASDAEALSIARSSPHFLNGGRIVVSLIETT